MRIKMKYGDLLRIDLPNGKYAFARVFRDATIAVFDYVADDPNKEPELNTEIKFYAGIYSDALQHKEWNLIKSIPFAEEENVWPPARYVEDSIDGSYSIYHKGDMRKSSKEKCIGLEVAAVWEPDQIIERIMGSDKWTEILS